MKTTLFSLLALGASVVSAFPSTMRHGHLHSTKRQDTQQWSGANVGGYGIAYDLMADNGGCRQADQIQSEIAQLVSNGYTTFRTYDVGCDNGALAAAIQQHPDCKLIAGILNLDTAGSLQKLIGMLSPYWAIVDTVYIGNELVNTGAASAGAVAAAVSTARGILNGAGFYGHVVTVDTWVAHRANPTLSSTSDYVAANTYAYFDGGVAAEGAGAWVKNFQGQVAAQLGKPVRITESGWPHCGNVNGQAVPGYSQQQAAVGSLKAAFADSPSDLILFQSHNAMYKAPGAGGVEQCWGLY